MSMDYYDDSLDSDNNLPQYARITFYDQLPYIMQKERVIIGRNSAAGSVDIDVGAVTFVSRKHLELTYSYQKLKVKCLGKNGIFIDNVFKSHSFIPYELPCKCTLRFPSTDVQFCVEQLSGLNSPDRVRGYGRMKNALRYVNDTDESPDYKRMKMMQSRSDPDSLSNDNHDGTTFKGLRDVICSLSDNEVEEYIHHEQDQHHQQQEDDEEIEEDDDVVDNINNRKLVNPSECDGLINDANEENDGVLIENMGSYTIESNGSIANLSKDYSLNNLKSNDINSMNILRGIDNNQLNIPSGRNVAKLYLSNFHCSNDQYFPNTRQVTLLEQDDMTIEHGSDTQKPPYSYAQLIVQAVSTARDRQLTLNGIYNYISKNYPYFKAHDKGWQNSVRHNLSLNRYFIKVPRGQDEPGKGSFWRVDPAYENKLIAQAFRKRRLRNNGSGGIVNDEGIVSQVLNVSSNIDGTSQLSNVTGTAAKVFGINKSTSHIGTANRTANFGNVITLKRACDIGAQNGGVGGVGGGGTASNSSAISSNNSESQKYIVSSNRNDLNSTFESISNISTNNSGCSIVGGGAGGGVINGVGGGPGGGTIFKCQSSKTVFLDGNNIKISGVLSKNKDLQIRSQANNPGTLISLRGRLFSTANIKSLQIQQQSQPRIFTSHSSIESANNQMKTSAINNNTINPKGNSFYIISPSGIKNHKPIALHSSPFDETIVHNSVQSPTSMSTNNDRCIINVQSHNPNIRKIDLSNGVRSVTNKETDLKSPIILKKVKLNNFITLKTEPKLGTNMTQNVIISTGGGNSITNKTISNTNHNIHIHPKSVNGLIGSGVSTGNNAITATIINKNTQKTNQLHSTTNHHHTSVNGNVRKLHQYSIHHQRHFEKPFHDNLSDDIHNDNDDDDDVDNNHHNRNHHNPHNDDDDNDIKLHDESDSQVFISDRDMDNSEMDHFLISHSDPSVSGLPLQERSEPGSSPDLYKQHDDDMWPDEVHKMESLKYTMHDSIVDTECD